MKFLLPCCLIASLQAQISVLPHPQGTFDSNQTVVWSPLWQSAWLELQEKAQDGRSEFADEWKKLIPPIEGHRATMLPEADHIVFSGKDDAALYQKANDESDKHWKFRPFAKKSTAAHPDRAILAMLHKTVYFKVPFERSLSTPMPFFAVDGRTDVQFFGTANGEMFSHVKVLHYDAKQRSQALLIPGRNAQERAIFYMPEESCLISEACATLRPLIKACDEAKGDDRDAFRLRVDDSILIPYVALHVSSDFAPFLRERKDQQTTTAVQKLFLQMDQMGSAKSYGHYQNYDWAADPFAQAEASGAHHFRFHKPFFLMLWKRNAEWPYLAIWVGDSSALQHWEE